MFPFMTPTQAIRLSMQTALMLAEAQAVMFMRLAGKAGGWSVTPGEERRMVAEKAQAAMASGAAIFRSAAAGGSPGAVALAGLKPVRAKTRANAARLAKRGPKLPGGAS